MIEPHSSNQFNQVPGSMDIGYSLAPVQGIGNAMSSSERRENKMIDRRPGQALAWVKSVPPLYAGRILCPP